MTEPRTKEIKSRLKDLSLTNKVLAPIAVLVVVVFYFGVVVEQRVSTLVDGAAVEGKGYAEAIRRSRSGSSGMSSLLTHYSFG